MVFALPRADLRTVSPLRKLAQAEGPLHKGRARQRGLFSLLTAYGAALCLAAFAGRAYAIDPSRAMSQYIHERWGAEQGFPPGPVYAISQSSDGYLWIGTRAGLVRFDGLNFRLVRDEPALPGESVLGLTSDRDGNLWVRLEGATLVRYRDGVFHAPEADRSLLGSQITATTQGSQGEFLASLMERGAIAWRRGGFEMAADASGLPRSPVLAVAQTSDGSIWAGTRGAGLFRMRQGRTTSVTAGLPDPKVNCLLASDGGDLWVGTDSGVVRWTGTRLTAAGIPSSFSRLQALALAQDRDANIWVGTDSGVVLRLNDRGAAPLDGGEGRSHEAVTALFEDREGNLWIGSDSGLERLSDSAFVTYSLPEGLPTDGSNPVFADAENRMWFAPVEGGLWWVKDGRHGRVTGAGLDRDVVYSIAGRDGELWLGRQNGGLTRVRSLGKRAASGPGRASGNGFAECSSAARGSPCDGGESGASFTARSWTQADGLAQDSVYSVYAARDGTVWAGTLSAGVSALRNGRFTNYTTADGLASNTVAAILESHSGTMWFATPRGLTSFAKGQWQSYTARNGLPSENVNCLLEDSTGMLWVGTTSGLSFGSENGFQVPRGAPAPLREQILGLAEDRYGWFWIATSNHVLRINRDKLLQNALAEGDVREFGLADGLRGLEGVKRNQSAMADAAGRIWFSMNRGISMVDPARLTRDLAPAIAQVQSIVADNQPIRVGASVRIPGGYRRIRLGFTGLVLSSPDRVRFRYQLEGFDHGWSEPSATREAVYTNLTPGPYRFRVIASNPDGVWSRDEAAIGLVVDPLFWQTRWFAVLLVLTFILAAAAVYRMRLHQLTRRLNVGFDERLAERTQIAQELHDTLLQGFLSASMQVHVAADRLPADSPVKPVLTRALQLMEQVTDEGRNALRGLRSSRSASLDLEQALARIEEEIVPAEPAGEPIAFRVVVDGQPRPLHPALRDDVYRIGREAVINAFRHSRAKSIDVGLDYSSGQLRLMVRDDGRGIDPHVVDAGRDGHWGLSGMRERAERIGAQFHVYSSATAGTEIDLSVPGRIAFPDRGHRPRKWFAGRQKPQNIASRQTEDRNGNNP